MSRSLNPLLRDLFDNMTGMTMSIQSYQYDTVPGHSEIHMQRIDSNRSALKKLLKKILASHGVKQQDVDLTEQLEQHPELMDKIVSTIDGGYIEGCDMTDLYGLPSDQGHCPYTIRQILDDNFYPPIP
jgi:hypothetical protein